MNITVGVLALQGAFNEHTQLLRQAAQILTSKTSNSSWSHVAWTFLEVRTAAELSRCDALIIPGGESTAISLVAQRSNLLEPLRDFVKVSRKPTWGTCAGLILLAESANRTKKGGQELIGGLDVRVNRNHFGRQIESFQANLDLPFLSSSSPSSISSPSHFSSVLPSPPSSHPSTSPTSPSPEPKDSDSTDISFKAIFIRAPIVERLLTPTSGPQALEETVPETIIAPSRALAPGLDEALRSKPVEILATLPGRIAALSNGKKETLDTEAGDIVAVRQGNVFGTSFHPELTGDPRIHVWWLEQAARAIEAAVATR